jgi:tRNA(Arg) A34 adenosine deaminase TadA
MSWTPQERDEHFMRRAVEIGKRNPTCPFGAVLVDIESWEIVAEGLNDSQSNPVRHGEIDAIEQCAAARPHIDWSKLWLYTAAEPCCMCQGAMLWAGIPRVIYGTSIETLKTMGWRQIDISAAEDVGRMPDVTCVIIGGILKDECDVLFRTAR